MYRLRLLFSSLRRMALFVLLGSAMANAQCLLVVDSTPSQLRTGPNELRGRSLMYPVQAVQGVWNVTLNTWVRLASQQQTLVGSASANFNWGPSSTVGSSGAEWADAFVGLEGNGSATYQTSLTASGTCNGGSTNYSGNTEYSLAMPISRPARPDYASPIYLSYYGGASSSHDAASNSFASSTNLVPGAANGASGSFTWEVAQGSSYANLSCTSCGVTTMTANQASDGCLVYNVQIKTNYGGFRSEPLWVFIDRPRYTVPNFSNHQNLNGGYLSEIGYTVKELCSSDLQNFEFNEIINGNTNHVSTNWPSLVTGPGAFQINYLIDVVSAQDGYCGQPCSPTPLNPGSGGPLVQSGPQFWRVGSQTAGSGMLVQGNVVQRYLDQGAHASVVSPIN
jgi:hypothetical protein